MRVLKQYVQEIGTISNYIRSLARILSDDHPDVSVLCTRAVVTLGEASDKLELRVIQYNGTKEARLRALARVNNARAALTGGAVMRCPHCGTPENPLDVLTGLCRCQEEEHEGRARARVRAAEAPRSHDLPVGGMERAPLPSGGPE